MIGTTISHYKILEKLGEGGMGVVYKAQDTKLDRLVALKFLPQHLSASEHDKARFIQEAKAASAMNHPNICTIYSIDEHDGQLFIAMEFVEGQTLREKCQSGIINPKSAIDIGVQIAEGLAAAHEKGIVHRDIKPENIMVRKDGIAQIMDFGLAKLRASGSKITRLTKEGSTVGTAGYMSPEQVQGEDTDHRSDIFSLGVLLYELFTGQLPFRGVHETALAYEIVNVDAAPMSSVKPEIDPALDAIVLECLEKDPNERTQSVRQIAVDLKRFRRESSRQRVSRVTAARPVATGSAISSAYGQQEPAVTRPSRITQKLPWIVAGVFFLAAVAAGSLSLLKTTSSPALVARAFIHPPAKTEFNSFVGGHIALSPDGTMLAFVARDSLGKDQLWVRPLRSLIALPLPGTDGASYPFWSPDNRTIAFFAQGKLKKIDAAGGPPLTICDAPNGRGGTWNTNGVIVFAPDNVTPLSQVRAEGGTPAAVTSLDTARGHINHRWPHFLPDGDRFLYISQSSFSGSIESDAMFLGSLSNPEESTRLIADATNMAYAGGFLFYLRQGVLMAHPFDSRRGMVTGEAVPVAENVTFGVPRSRGIFSVSASGVLVYESQAERRARLALLDRRGAHLATLSTRELEIGARFSPDGKKVAFSALDNQRRYADIWIHDLARKLETRFTFHQSVNRAPGWSHDGAHVFFSSNRSGNFSVYWKLLVGSDDEEVVYSSPLADYVTRTSPDGKYLLLTTIGDPKTKLDVHILPMYGDRTPRAVAKSEFEEASAAFSPDGRWIAYQSDESGRNEVYVQPFEGRGKWQISANGGGGPFWVSQGREIIFVSADRKVTSVEVRASGPSFDVGKSTVLFDADAAGMEVLLDISADGQTFLVSHSPGGGSNPLTLVMNWQEELKRR